MEMLVSPWNFRLGTLVPLFYRSLRLSDHWLTMALPHLSRRDLARIFHSAQERVVLCPLLAVHVRR